MAYWLIKSEPHVFSWADQVAHQIEPWTGIRNYQARKNLITMQVGDRAFFYHSNVQRAIVGMVEVVCSAYPDPTAGEGNWVCVDVKTIGPMPSPVSLASIKNEPLLAQLTLIKQPRLSVCPISEEQWTILCQMGKWQELTP
ncbi:MAG: EVE domain-containing protein [Acetobacter sp.]|nr:EVE domain-containing protein [Acetobacter sp.]